MKTELKELIYSDLYRYESNTKLRSYLKQYLINPSFRYTILLRKTKYYNKKNIILFLLNRILLRRYSLRYGFQISYKVKIDKGFYIGHYGRIVINPNVKIGRNVNIGTGVTIGQTNRGILKGVPTIEDEVSIGTNAVIVGNINIGKNVLIAPNSYVNVSIPENSIAIGNPVIIINRMNATKDYINRKV